MKTSGIVLILTCLMILTGCAATNEANLDSGSYQMVVSGDKALYAPVIVLNQENCRFTFTYDLLSSRLNDGSYVVETNLLTATANDGRQYVFQIVDNRTLSFMQEQSSQIALTDERFGVSVCDGALFKFIENTKPLGE